MFREDIDDRIANLPDAASPRTADFGARDIGWQALGPTIACVILSTCVVAVRWYTRCKIVRCVGLDDWTMLLSLATAWAMCGVIAAAVYDGVGTYSGTMQLTIVTKLIVINNDLWAATVNITKASILMQYLRIFSGTKTRAICFSLLALLLPAVCWATIGGTLLCQPVAKLWNPRLPGRCMSAQTYWLSVAGIDISLDFLVLVLPMPAISSLHLPRKQRTSLILVFVLGFFVCAVSIARLATVLTTSNEGDFTASGIWAIIWSVVEANVGIICASLLALRPLLDVLFPRLMQENELPRHRMRLAKVSTRSTWPSESTLVNRSPTTPTTPKSTIDGTSKRFSVSPLLASAETTPRMPRRPPPVRGGEREVVSFMDML